MLGTPSLYRVLWEQPFIDLWTIPHTLIGVVFAYVALRRRIPLWAALAFSVAFGIAWELMEYSIGVSEAEPFFNHFSDILVTQVGFTAGWLLFLRFSKESGDRAFTWVAGVLIASCGAGILGHQFLGPK